MSNFEGFCFADLRVERGTLVILDGAELSARPGQILALTGPNGSGKTSLLEALAGLVPAGQGRIMMAGERLEHLPPHQRARLGLRLVRDRRMVFADLTVRENLAIVRGYLNHVAPPDLDAFPIISQRLGQRAGALSGGEKRIVAILTALLAGPRVLMIDEFSEGLHPSVIPDLLAAIRRCCDRGMIAVLVVHSATLIAREKMVQFSIEGRRLRFDMTRQR